MIAFHVILSLLFTKPILVGASVQQGWSLESATCPAGSTSCGGDACCPSSLHCNPHANDEVVACCSSRSDCRGSVEASSKCADSSWSLWKGIYGNGFCCLVGQTGAYDSENTVAGTCVANGQIGSLTSAILVSTGTGSTTTIKSTTTTRFTTTTSFRKKGSNLASPPNTNIAMTTTTTADTTTSTPSTTSTPGDNGTRYVFAHYMVGSMTASEAVTDVQDALNAGFDGFALNTHTISSSDTWNTEALGYLFSAASGTNFKLFISFDMSWGLNVAGLPAFLAGYVQQDAYLKIDGKPFVSTYSGGNIDSNTWDTQFRQPLMANYGVTPYFVPDFDNWSGYPNGFIAAYPVIDGAFTWESAWPAPGQAVSNVTDTVDQNIISQATAAGKTYMMPISTLQFKYTSDGNHWYRVGESNLPDRMQQILSLQPDFVEFITWNDAGESHYIGNNWPEAISGSPDIQAYSNGFNHKGWLQIISPFISAYKSGATDVSQISTGSAISGSIWYRTLLTSASCSGGIQNYQEAQDAINFAIILPQESATSYTIIVSSNGQQIGSFTGQPGLNWQTVLGLQAGSADSQVVQVVDGSGNIVASAAGTKDVLSQSDSSLCNWNYEVAGLS